MEQEQWQEQAVSAHEGDSSSTIQAPNQPTSRYPGLKDLIRNLQAQMQVLMSGGFANPVHNTGPACFQHTIYSTSMYTQFVPSQPHRIAQQRNVVVNNHAVLMQGYGIASSAQSIKTQQNQSTHRSTGNQSNGTADVTRIHCNDQGSTTRYAMHISKFFSQKGTTVSLTMTAMTNTLISMLQYLLT